MDSKIMTVDQAIDLIDDGMTLATGGFVGCGHPEALTAAIEDRFLKEQHPRDLTLVYAAGQGDGKDRGLNHMGHEGILKRVVGGHWNLAPKMGQLALENKIEAYNFPQGVMCHLFREIANGSPGKISHVGLGTFVDPRFDGGKLNARTKEDLVSLIELEGREWLFYKTFAIDFCLLRGTASDTHGNISFENEAITAEVLSIAQATRNSGGTVIVQVEKIVPVDERDPKSIRVPGIFVDGVVLADKALHPQTFAEDYNPGYVHPGDIDTIDLPKMEKGARRIISSRAFEEFEEGDIVNLGIGVPEGVALMAREYHKLDKITLTLESGPVGGLPAGGLSFGASMYPQAIIDQPYMFDFYDGGGLDVAFLGMAECDGSGNVNVSKFGGRVAGIGGFMNISQTAQKVVFTGTFTVGGLNVEWENDTLHILQEGKYKKFTQAVEHITFSGALAWQKGQKILYVTERAVFRLSADGPELIELAPGIDIEKNIIPYMDFKLRVSPDLKPMHTQHFE